LQQFGGGILSGWQEIFLEEDKSKFEILLTFCSSK
jgi:hypothetical protein